LIRCVVLFLLLSQAVIAQEQEHRFYDVNFSGTFKPQRGVIEASISVQQSSQLLIQLDMAASPDRYSGFQGDGEVEREGRRLLWSIPAEGGTLNYEVEVDHERGLLMDAQMTQDWAILRLDDVFPAARVRSLVGAHSRSTLQLNGPGGWRFESRYGRLNGKLGTEDPERRFDRPTGWLAAGKLGVRRTTIGARKISVAAPRDQGMRRLDIIAFTRWNLPRLVKVFPQFPDQLLIVGARDDMWRGGLSGPDSIYLHADRPLISENSTSPLLHELVHLATAQSSAVMADWIVEGLAEYYSLTVLLRSGGISEKRYDQAMDSLVKWAKRDKGRLRSPSSGANTARAVQFFEMIQTQLTRNDAGRLDTIVQELMTSETADGERLLTLVEQQLGKPSSKLRTAYEEFSASPE